MSEIEKLKRCPFCGGQAEVRKFTSTMIFVQCKNCLAGSTAFPTDEEAVTAWNKRWRLSSRVRKVVREWLKNFLKD